MTDEVVVVDEVVVKSRVEELLVAIVVVDVDVCEDIDGESERSKGAKHKRLEIWITVNLIDKFID